MRKTLSLRCARFDRNGKGAFRAPARVAQPTIKLIANGVITARARPRWHRTGHYFGRAW
jgi:hypothetical protein